MKTHSFHLHMMNDSARVVLYEAQQANGSLHDYDKGSMYFLYKNIEYIVQDVVGLMNAGNDK